MVDIIFGSIVIYFVVGVVIMIVLWIFARDKLWSKQDQEDPLFVGVCLSWFWPITLLALWLNQRSKKEGW